MIRMLAAAWLAVAPPLAAQPPASPSPAAAATGACSQVAGPRAGMFVGIDRFDVTITCPGLPGTTRAHVVRVDLSAPGLSFDASSGVGGTFQTELPTHYLARTGSQLAFNANLFTHCCSDAAAQETRLQGLEIGGGRVHSPAGSNPVPTQAFPFDMSLAASGGNLAILPSFQVDPRSTDAAVTGSHSLVLGGKNIAPDYSSQATDFFTPKPRTLVGLPSDRRVFWVVAADRGAASAGLTLPQAAQLMLGLGAADAINLDGGGSTSLAVQMEPGSPRLLNLPSDRGQGGCTLRVGAGCERYVGAIFAIRAMPLPGRSARP